MTDLQNLSSDRLRETLSEVSSAKAAKRLMIALAYKDGVSVSTLSERYGIPRSTIYYWFDRFEDRSLEAAIEDETRPGRPAALTVDDRERFRAELDRPPSEFGYESGDWTAELVQKHLLLEYNIEYSLGHVRRLIRDFE